MVDPIALWASATEQGLEVSPQDDRNHRVFTLPNGLRALASSDPSSEKAASALAISVGSSADPWELPGLAHFCEHMCFLGSEKYPEESAYKKYLSAHGGKANASTSSDRTVFQFDVQFEHLEQALDIFAQFFVAPLFTESATDRELNAVDSEDSKNRCNDGRRFLQVSRALAIPTHPYAKFSTGNLHTLRADVPSSMNTREALLAFHRRHYTAPRMCLVVCGREPLDVLEQWICERFGNVPAEPRPPADPLSVAACAVAAGAQDAGPPPAGDGPLGLPFVSPFRNADLPCFVEIAPLRELRSIQLSWTMPAMKSLYRADAVRLFSHLLGHEGEGSVFANLQDLGWATSLSAGAGHSDERFSVFQVNVSLTPQGEDNWPHIVVLVLEYCELLRNISPEEMQRVWVELRATSALFFRFQQKAQPYDYVQAMARRLHLYDVKHVFSAGHLFDELSHATVEHLAKRLVPENLTVRLVSARLGGSDFTDEERWYKIPFSRRALPSEATKARELGEPARVHFPAPNAFIPDDLSLRGPAAHPRLSSPVSPPQLLAENDRGRLWHKTDERYAQPRAELYLLLRSPMVRRELVLAQLLVAYMGSRAKQSLYPAKIAGLHWSLSHNKGGLVLNVSGFSQRAPILLSRIICSLLIGPWDGEDPAAQNLRFDAVRDRMHRSLRSWNLERPDAHASYWAGIFLGPESPTIAEKLAIIEVVTLEDTKRFHTDFVAGPMFSECFVAGNVSRDEALALYGGLLSELARTRTLPPDFLPEDSLNQLRSGESYEIHAAVANDQEQNSAVYVYFQAGELLPERQAALRMILQLMREPFFSQLRTQQQVGYVVSSGIEVEYIGPCKIEGFALTVLSNRLSALEVVRRVDAFLAGFRETLSGVDVEAWAITAKALAAKLLEPPRKISEEASRHWSVIRNRSLRWGWREDVAEALQTICPGDAVGLYDQLVSLGTRRRVGSLVFGNSFPLQPEEGTDAEAVTRGVVRVTCSRFRALRMSLPRFASGIRAAEVSY